MTWLARRATSFARISLRGALCGFLERPAPHLRCARKANVQRVPPINATRTARSSHRPGSDRLPCAARSHEHDRHRRVHDRPAQRGAHDRPDQQVVRTIRESAESHRERERPAPRLRRNHRLGRAAVDIEHDLLDAAGTEAQRERSPLDTAGLAANPPGVSERALRRVDQDFV